MPTDNTDQGGSQIEGYDDSKKITIFGLSATLNNQGRIVLTDENTGKVVIDTSVIDTSAADIVPTKPLKPIIEEA